MKTIKKRTEPKKVSAFACGVCDGIYLDRQKAAECCTCSVCDDKFESFRSYTSTCDSCSYGAQLREARAAVKRSEVDLRIRQDRLAELLRQGKPKKGTP